MTLDWNKRSRSGQTNPGSDGMFEVIPENKRFEVFLHLDRKWAKFWNFVPSVKDPNFLNHSMLSEAEWKVLDEASGHIIQSLHRAYCS